MRAVIPSSYAPLLAAHQHAVRAFIDRAQELSPQEWEAPLDAGKWSPAQIAEHLRLAYTVFSSELEGGQGLRIRVTGWKQVLVRMRYLGKILRSGRLPAGARSPREARPGDGPFDRSLTLAAIASAASRFEEALAERWDNANARLTHHVFGGMSPKKAIRFVTVHTEHHTRQLPRTPR